jgi:hypothetical protein
MLGKTLNSEGERPEKNEPGVLAGLSKEMRKFWSGSGNSAFNSLE